MGPSVVVTGATGGIGRVTVMELAAAGFDVIATATAAERAEELADEVNRRGLRLRTVVLDVTDHESCVRAFTDIAALTDGGPWAVVNNAGIAQPGAVEDVDDDAARYQLEVNLLGVARILRLVLPAMRQRGTGRVINISSSSARVHNPFLGWYCASKLALEALTDALRIESAPFGVRVSLIEPGSFATNIWRRAIAALPATENSPYRDAYREAGRVLARSSSLPEPTPVAHTVLRALRAHRPRPRYVVGSGVRTGALLDSLVPTPVVDYAKEMAVGLRTPQTLLTGVVARRLRR